MGARVWFNKAEPLFELSPRHLREIATHLPCVGVTACVLTWRNDEIAALKEEFRCHLVRDLRGQCLVVWITVLVAEGRKIAANEVQVHATACALARYGSQVRLRA